MLLRGYRAFRRVRSCYEGGRKNLGGLEVVIKELWSIKEGKKLL